MSSYGNGPDTSVAALSKQRNFARVHEQDVRGARRAGGDRNTRIAPAEYPFFGCHRGVAVAKPKGAGYACVTRSESALARRIDVALPSFLRFVEDSTT